MPHRLQEYYPAKPKHHDLQNAYIIICNSHKASSALLQQFQDVRKYRKAKGTPTDAEQDLLRAMLVFACAGLDSMIKQLIRDALPRVIKADEGAAAMFLQRTKKVIYRDNILNVDLLLSSIMTDAPREVLQQDLVRNLTSGSLQSVDELLKAASFFNIPSKSIAPNPQDVKLVFAVRNEISHEMDIDFSQNNRNRRPRARDTMIRHVNQVFAVAKAFLEQTDKKLEDRTTGPSVRDKPRR